jgi:hypothetical protein
MGFRRVLRIWRAKGRKLEVITILARRDEG